VKRSETNQLMLDIQNYLFDKGVFAWRQNTQGRIGKGGKLLPAMKKGVPDILGCYKGHFFGVEVKTGRDVLSYEQKGFIQSVFFSGGRVFVAHNLDDFIKDFELWIKAPPAQCSWLN